MKKTEKQLQLEEEFKALNLPVREGEQRPVGKAGKIPVNIYLNAELVSSLKKLAEGDGVNYQTLIQNIVQQFIMNS